MSKVSYFVSGNNPKNPKYFDIKDMLEGIKSGSWQDQTLKYRSLVEKHGKDDISSKRYKVSIPGFTVSGTFSHRSTNNLINHSGFVAVDIDNVTSDIHSLKSHIDKDKFTYSCFISVGGNGICVIMKVDPSQHNQELFEHIQDYYLENFEIPIDFLADVARFRFVSYDPELCINEESDIFTFQPDTTREEVNGQIEAAISEGVESQIKLAERIVQSEITYQEGSRHRYVYGLAKLLNKMGVSKEDATNYIYSEYPHFAQNPSNAIEWTYKNKISKFGEWKKPIKKGNSLEPATLEQIQEKFSFIKSFIDIKKDKEVFYVDEMAFYQWLEDEGFGVYFRGSDMLIVRVIDGVIYDFTREKLKNWISSKVSKYPFLKSKIIKKKGLLSAERMPYLPNLTSKLVPIRDTKTNCFLFFKNGYLDISYEGATMNSSYDGLEFLVWESDLLDFEYKKESYESSDFFKFCQNITNNDITRMQGLMTALGYSIHTYKDALNSKSVVFVDENSNPDEANGGTGKSLLTMALSKIRPSVMQDGKRFGKNNIRFLYQDIKESTKLLIIDDIDRYFQWSFLFSAITAGIQVEQKGLQPFFIPFENSPKLVISTNYMVRQQDESTKRRFVEVELYPYYSNSHSPKDDFEKAFFFEWEEIEWNQFFTFMADCVRLYLSSGIIKTVTETTGVSKLATMTSSDFAEFAWNRFEPSIEYISNEQQDTFVIQNPDYLEGKNKMTNHRWSRWIKAFAQCKGYKLDSYRKGDQNIRHFNFSEQKSN